MGTQTQFENLLRDIEPSQTTTANASSAHTGLRKYLAEHEVFSEVHLDTFLAGSYMRDTSIRPRTVNGKESKPDVDIIVVTNHTLSDDPKEILRILRKTLAASYELDDNPHERSVGVITSAVEMDVVPIIAPNGMNGTLYLPDKRLEEWIQTNPPGHTKWSTEVNKSASGRFKPLTKIMKWWRREQPTISSRPKGFIVECIVAECMNRSEKNYPQLFVSLLEAIENRYAWNISQRSVPLITDPGVPGKSVTERLKFSAFEGFYYKVQEHADLGRRALAEVDEEKALALWRRIFGSRFPHTGSRSAAASLLMGAASPSPFSFPDRPVVPKKPGGFA